GERASDGGGWGPEADGGEAGRAGRTAVAVAARAPPGGAGHRAAVPGDLEPGELRPAGRRAQAEELQVGLRAEDGLLPPGDRDQPEDRRPPGAHLVAVEGSG